jgi:SMC interacting uncharacterized protein involved in chromosome segregation
LPTTIVRGPAGDYDHQQWHDKVSSKFFSELHSMTGYLGKKLLGLIVVAACLLVGYNYFWGTPEEKESAQKIIGEFTNLSNSVKNLLVSEKDKFDEGKYDTAISKLKEAVAVLKEKATSMGSDGQRVLNSVNELEQKEEALEEELASLNAPASTTSGKSSDNQKSRAESLRQHILELNKEAEQLSQKLKF